MPLTGFLNTKPKLKLVWLAINSLNVAPANQVWSFRQLWPTIYFGKGHYQINSVTVEFQSFLKLIQSNIFFFFQLFKDFPLFSVTFAFQYGICVTIFTIPAIWFNSLILFIRWWRRHIHMIYVGLLWKDRTKKTGNNIWQWSLVFSTFCVETELILFKNYRCILLSYFG